MIYINDLPLGENGFCLENSCSRVDRPACKENMILVDGEPSFPF